MAGRRSKISRLPAAVRDKINAQIKAGRTIDEIMAHLARLDVEISRSAVGRYKQKTETTMRRYREAQDVAGVWISKMGQDGDVGRLLQEMLKTIAFQKMADMGDEEAEAIDPKDIHFFARALKDIESATKLSVDREKQIREEEAKKAVEAVTKVAKKNGVENGTIEEFRAAILGVERK